MSDRLALPVRPAPPDPPPFPLVGALAPIVLAAVLFAVLRTPTVLLLAVFSPVLAVAAVLDGRLQTRRRSKRDVARHEQALDALEREVLLRRSAAVAEAHLRTPTPAVLVADPARWAGRPPSGELVLGTAELPCPAIVTGSPITDRERILLRSGAVLPEAPVTVPAETSVAVVGPQPLAAAFARAVAVAGLRGRGSADRPSMIPAAAGSSADLVIELDDRGGATVVHASGPAAAMPVRTFRPAFVTAAAFRGTVGTGGPRDLRALLADPARGGLAARFAEDGDGPVDVDLVADGPHAVVGGTTGSGKSALLTAWILALAVAHPPERLVLLLVDCKGGAAFDPLAALPHVAGVVTDLDSAGAERAIASLAAELRRRERAVREAGVPDAAAAGLPGLVVVVDEYRALVERSPALAALFADLAARGRSLGVHLVLCTQRPGGSVRDDVLANCPIRLSLRVHDAVDSIAVVGTDAAARLGRRPVGAAVLVTDRRRQVRVARVTADTVRDVVAGLAAAHPEALAAPPWLPPLPGRVPLPAARDWLVPLGLLDLPEEQLQPALLWDPRRRPRLLVIGDAGSGRTGALAAVAHGLDAGVVAGTTAALWDALHDDASPLLVDDLDHLLDRLDDQRAGRAVERLAERLRHPAAAPTAVTVRGPGAWAGLPIRGLVGLFDDVLLLSLGLDDHLSVGGRRDAWQQRLAPGGGWYQGCRLQVGEAPAARTRQVPVIPELAADTTAAVLTSRPVERTAQLIAAGRIVLAPDEAGDPPPGALAVGSPAAWQARWQALAALAARLPVLVDGCGAADVRALLGRSAALPPVDGRDDVVLVPTEGEPARVRLPRPDPAIAAAESG